MIHTIVSAVTRAFATMRMTLFTTRMEWEMFHRIAPHLLKEKNHGYPFSTNEEMDALAPMDDIEACLHLIATQTEHMPNGYGKAFRYLMHRDLDRRLRMYANLAQWRIPPPLRVAKYA